MKATYVLAVALLAAPGAAVAQQTDDGVRGRWSMTVSAGVTMPTGGEFHEGGRGTVLGLATSVEPRGSGDVFDPGFGWNAGIGYGVSRRVELFGAFAWQRNDASELSVGNVATLDLRAAFGEYTSYGVDGGMRFHLMPGGRLAPYVSAQAGFRRVEAIPGTFSVPAAGVTLPDTPFYDDSTVPVFGGGAGVLFAASSRISVGVDASVRYHGDLADLEGLAGTGLENLNDAGSRWDVPIAGVVRFGF